MAQLTPLPQALLYYVVVESAESSYLLVLYTLYYYSSTTTTTLAWLQNPQMRQHNCQGHGRGAMSPPTTPVSTYSENCERLAPAQNRGGMTRSAWVPLMVPCSLCLKVFAALEVSLDRRKVHKTVYTCLGGVIRQVRVRPSLGDHEGWSIMRFCMCGNRSMASYWL